MSEFEAFITNTGFPVFIAMYLLIRFDRKIDMLVGAFVDLTEALNGMMNHVASQHESVEIPHFSRNKLEE